MPNTVTATPRCANDIPQWLRESCVSPFKKPWRCVARSCSSISVRAITQTAIISPSTVIAIILSCSHQGRINDAASVITSAITSLFNRLDGSSRRQRTSGAIPSSREKGTISQINMVSKNGAPTEIDPSPSCLCTKGSRVPKSTTIMAAISSMLLPSKKDSREKNSWWARVFRT